METESTALVPSRDGPSVGLWVQPRGSRDLSQQVQEKLRTQGVVFGDLGSALRLNRVRIKRFEGLLLPLRASRGLGRWNDLFVYIPPGVELEMPLHSDLLRREPDPNAHDRIVIVCDEGSRLSFIDGCTAPIYRGNPFHQSVVEVVVGTGAHCRYTTLQNWATHVRDHAFKRAHVHADAMMEWIGLHMGGRRARCYPSVNLLEPGASCEIASLGIACGDQHQHIGGHVEHRAPHTNSSILSRSISANGGQVTHRGWIKVCENSRDVHSSFRTDALLQDAASKSETCPFIETHAQEGSVSHTSHVRRMDQDQVFYLKSRGLSEEKAGWMVVDGFIGSFARRLPMEYAVELRRLVEMDGVLA